MSFWYRHSVLCFFLADILWRKWSYYGPKCHGTWGYRRILWRKVQDWSGGVDARNIHGIQRCVSSPSSRDKSDFVLPENKHRREFTARTAMYPPATCSLGPFNLQSFHFRNHLKHSIWLRLNYENYTADCM